MIRIGYGASDCIQMDDTWVTNGHWAFIRRFFEKNFHFNSARLNKLLLAWQVIHVIKEKPLDYRNEIQSIKNAIGVVRGEGPGEALTYRGTRNGLDTWVTNSGTKIKIDREYRRIVKPFVLMYMGKDKAIKLYKNGGFVGVIAPWT